MGQCRETGMMQSRQEKPGRDANAFWDVVVLEPRAVVEAAPPLRKDDNKPGCNVQVRF